MDTPADAHTLWQGEFLGNPLYLYITPKPNLYSYKYETPEFNIEGSITVSRETVLNSPETLVDEILQRVEAQYKAVELQRRINSNGTIH